MYQNKLNQTQILIQFSNHSHHSFTYQTVLNQLLSLFSMVLKRNSIYLLNQIQMKEAYGWVQRCQKKTKKLYMYQMNYLAFQISNHSLPSLIHHVFAMLWMTYTKLKRSIFHSLLKTILHVWSMNYVSLRTKLKSN